MTSNFLWTDERISDQLGQLRRYATCRGVRLLMVYFPDAERFATAMRDDYEQRIDDYEAALAAAQAQVEELQREVTQLKKHLSPEESPEYLAFLAMHPHYGDDEEATDDD